MDRMDAIFEKLDVITAHTFQTRQDVAVMMERTNNEQQKLDTHLSTHIKQPCQHLTEHKKNIKWAIGLVIPALTVVILKLWNLLEGK